MVVDNLTDSERYT